MLAYSATSTCVAPASRCPWRSVVPDHVVAAWHGHDEAVMRRVYTHTFMDDMKAAAAAMAAASTDAL